MLENNQKELILLKDLGMSFATSTSKHKRHFGLYRCYCGNEFKSTFYSIKSGNAKSCGCLNKKNQVECNTTHGYSKHRLYGTWIQMIDRCKNKDNANYLYYGGNGITVCERWLNIANFIDDMYPTFQEGLTLDRKNPNGNYEKDNCRWATKTTQSRNTRKINSANKTGYRGVSFCNYYKKYSCNITLNYKKKNLGYFKTPLEAAKAYDQYVIDNNLEHTLNGVLT